LRPEGERERDRVKKERARERATLELFSGAVRKMMRGGCC